MDKNDLRFFLMHKDIVIAQMEIDDARPHKITFTRDASEHLPPGAQMNMVRFHEWWEDRAVPRTRQGAKSALRKPGYATTGYMLVDNLALSLTDCYWIRPRTADISWPDVSLFTNPFVDYFGEITISSNADVGRRSRFSLATSQGELSVHGKCCAMPRSAALTAIIPNSGISVCAMAWMRSILRGSCPTRYSLTS